MAYKLGILSRDELQGVHPSLVKVVERAIKITKQDFAVHDGLRTPREQKALLAKGATTTLHSKHLVQKDGYGHAVDLVPYINGKLRWEWGPIYLIAEAVRTAARDCNVKLRWGGVWDRNFTELQGSPKDEVEAYCKRHAGRDFIDGPHFELIA